MATRNFDSGIDESTAQLIKTKARRLVGRAGFVEDDLEDLEQELRLEVLLRLRRYDPNRGSRRVFIACVADHKIANLKEFQKAKVRGYRRNAYSLNAPVNPEDEDSAERGETIDLEDYLLRTGRLSRPTAELRDLARDLGGVLDCLPPKLRDLCARLDTQTITEISEDTGIPRGTIYEWRRKVRAIFEEAGLRGYR